MDKEKFRDVRLLLAYGGINYQFVRVSMDKTGEDASLYIYPYSKQDIYKGLTGTIQPDGQGNFKADIDVSSAPMVVNRGLPHLSLHESGRVHVRLDNSEQPFGMLWAKPLAKLEDPKGDHIASINVSSLDALPPLLTEPDDDESKSQYDKVITINPSEGIVTKSGNGWQAQTFIVYASVDRRKYAGVPLVKADVRRSVGRPSIFYTICHRPAGIDYGEGEEPSVAVIGGWNIDQMDKKESFNVMWVIGT